MRNITQWHETSLRELLHQPKSGVSVLVEDMEPPPNAPSVLRLSCIAGGRFNPRDAKMPLSDEVDRLDTYAEANTILVSRSNTPALVGATAFVSSDHPNAFLPDTLWLLRAKNQNKVSMQWLAYVLGSDSYRLSIQRIASGTSESMKKIQKGAFLKLKVCLPPIDEQRKIAAILTVWDEALEKLDAIIAAKERYKKGLMQQLLTGRRRLKGFVGKWVSTRFDDLLVTEDRYVEFDNNTTYGLVSIRRRAGGVFFREELRGGAIRTKIMKKVYAGDFLISRMQVVHGALGMVQQDCDGLFASNSYEVLVAKDPARLHMPFLDWLSRQRSFWNIAYTCSHGVHIEKMTFKLDDFMQARLILPFDLDEQRAITNVLDTCAEELRLLRAQRDTRDKQKRGLMQQLLTGKIR